MYSSFPPATPSRAYFAKCEKRVSAKNLSSTVFLKKHTWVPDSSPLLLSPPPKKKDAVYVCQDDIRVG